MLHGMTLVRLVSPYPLLEWNSLQLQFVTITIACKQTTCYRQIITFRCIGALWLIESPALAAAATASWFHRRAGINSNVLPVHGRNRRTHFVLNLSGHRHECLLHIRRALRARLEEWYAQMVGVLLERENRIVTIKVFI